MVMSFYPIFVLTPYNLSAAIITTRNKLKNRNKMSGQAIKFGTFIVTSQVFYQSSKSFGLVNLKPLVPGHVLVCPRRVVPRISGLTADEAADFYALIQRVSIMIEKYYKADALNIAIQDGALAGQSVPHVHCHIIPRKLNDLPDPDDIYRLLDGKEGDLDYVFNTIKKHKSSDFFRVDNDSRMPRGIDEMEQEARDLAEFMKRENL
jgi:bis(5'-adenosyl)-triphosphatase